MGHITYQNVPGVIRGHISRNKQPEPGNPGQLPENPGLKASDQNSGSYDELALSSLKENSVDKKATQNIVSKETGNARMRAFTSVSQMANNSRKLAKKV